MKKLKLSITIVSLLLLLCIFCNGWYIEIIPTQQNYTSQYNKEQTYKPPIAYLKGKYYCKNGVEINIEIKEDIIPTKIGSYEIVSNANFLFLEEEFREIYQVIDKTNPKITLLYKEDYMPNLNEEYVEEGFVAYDEYDGDITKNVVTYMEENIKHYVVKDSSGNETHTTREIKYKDNIPPELTLLGEDVVTMVLGDEYIEQGFTAIDNVDGDISENVVVMSNLDKDTIGTYEIQYVAKDKENNESIVVRTIIVEQPNYEKAIYLTFDDGPSKYTVELLDILDKYDVKATFFVVATPYKDLIEEIYKRGHSIGVHSYTHRFGEIYASEENYFNDLTLMNDCIYEQTGIYSNIIRFPGGSSNSVSAKYNKGIMSRLAAEVQNRGFQYFDWNVASEDDKKGISKQKIYKNILDGLKEKEIAIVLQHDTKQESIAVVEDVIIWGKNNGYVFLPLDINSPITHHNVVN